MGSTPATSHSSLPPTAFGDAEFTLPSDLTQKLSWWFDAVRHANLGMSFFDNELVLRYCNEALAQILGAKREDLLGKTLDALHTKKQFRGEILPLLEEARGHGFASGEVHHKKLSGRSVPTEKTIIQLTDSSAQAAGYISFTRDITNRHKTEQALFDSEERYRALLNNSLDIIYVCDIKGRIIDANDRARELFGFKEKSIPRITLKDIVHPKAFASVSQWLEDYVTGRNLSDLHEFRLIKHQGDEIWVETTAVPIVRKKKIVALIGIARDITKRKHAEAELKAAEKQLQLSQKLEAVGRLAGGVAHDFNNIISVIRGYAEVVIEELDDYELPAELEPIHEDLNGIISAIERAATLTRQLLAFSRRQVLKPVALDLNNTVRGMEKMLRRLIGDDIELIAHLSGDLHRIKADPSQIEQVLMNLAVNARDAMPKGGSIVIETENRFLQAGDDDLGDDAEPGHYATLVFTDTGTGMDDATRAKIFEPFFTTKKKGKGTGLGLSTVYGIIKQSGGAIRVESSDHHPGTRFTILLPMTGDRPTEVVRVETWAQSLHGSETILLVEDDDMLRNLVFRMLTRGGYEVLAARHGGDALLISDTFERDIHLLITDVSMPKISGYELAKRLQNERPGLEVLFMTGALDDVELQANHLDRLIQKPFSVVALATSIRSMLDSDDKNAG